MDAELSALVDKAQRIQSDMRAAREANRARMQQHLPTLFALCEQLKEAGITFRVVELQTPT